MHRRFVLALSLLASLWPRASSADRVSACARAAEASQEHRAAGRLVQARDALVTCAATSCPAVVRNDCAAWLSQVESSLPSVIIAAHDEAGRDVAGAKAWVDGVARPIDGLPLSLDPGEHELRVEADGHVPQRVQLVARTAEQRRLVLVTLHRPAAPSASSSSPPPPPPKAPPVEASKGPSAGGIALLGVSAVALGVFAVLGATARSRADELRQTCAPRCTQDDVDAVRRRLVAADVALGVSAVAGVAGAIVLLSPSSDGAPKGAMVRFGGAF